MREVVKMITDTNMAIKKFIVKQLTDLNREIVEAAEDGDIIRKDIIDTKIETLEELCDALQNFCFIHIGREEVWSKFDFNFDGVDAIQQFFLCYNGQIIPCENIAIIEKKGA